MWYLHRTLSHLPRHPHSPKRNQRGRDEDDVPPHDIRRKHGTYCTHLDFTVYSQGDTACHLAMSQWQVYNSSAIAAVSVRCTLRRIRSSRAYLDKTHKHMGCTHPLFAEVHQARLPCAAQTHVQHCLPPPPRVLASAPAAPLSLKACGIHPLALPQMLPRPKAHSICSLPCCPHACAPQCHQGPGLIPAVTGLPRLRLCGSPWAQCPRHPALIACAPAAPPGPNAKGI